MTQTIAAELRGLELVDQHRVATHLAVVVHAVLGVLGVEVGPVAALAEQQQPVVAQAIFLVGAGVAREEVLHLARTRLVEPRLEFPVGGPGFERVAAGLELGMGKVAAPLRVAMTGTQVSPSIEHTIYLAGRDGALARIDEALARARG